MSFPFDFHDIICSTLKKTKTFVLSINRPSKNNVLRKETLLEIEQALGRIALHSEINTLFIKGEGTIFSDGIDSCELRGWSSDELNIFNESLKKIVTVMPLLPQIVVMDLGERALGHALELALGADIRLSKKDAHIEFNFLSKGLCPSAGGISHLQRLVGPSCAKFWILGSHRLLPREIENSNFIHKTYDNEGRQDYVDNLLSSLHCLAPVCRVQAKRSFFESFAESFERANFKEGEFARAAHFCEDWKVDSGLFTSIADMKKIMVTLKPSQQV